MGMLGIVGAGLIACGLFTLLSGAIYLVNDSVDAEKDRAHPEKRNRPIAAGLTPVSLALACAGVLGSAAVAGSFLMSFNLGYLALGYVVLMVFYSLALKDMVILDVMTISAGFVLRATAGSFAIEDSIIIRGGVETTLDLTISPWLYIVTALGALLIALAKRKSELAGAGERSSSQRASLSQYSEPVLDQIISIVASATLVSYTLYTFSGGITGANVPANNSMLLTVPFVAYGLFRYLFLVYRHRKGEAPEDILVSDWPLIINITLWVAAASALLILNR